MSAGVAAPSPQTPAHRVPPHHCIAAPWRLACKNLFWLGRIFGHGPQAVMPWLRILRPMRRRRAATRRNTPQHAATRQQKQAPEKKPISSRVSLFGDALQLHLARRCSPRIPILQTFIFHPAHWRVGRHSPPPPRTSPKRAAGICAHMWSEDEEEDKV